jgi:hypothetical protein
VNRRGWAAATLTAILLAACATELDPDVEVPDTGTAPATTEFVATGSTEELLDQLLDEAAGLSEAIVENEGQRDIIARIDVIWEAARPGIEATSPDDVLGFDRTIALMHRGVDRRRPADADRALINLRNLVAAVTNETSPPPSV